MAFRDAANNRSEMIRLAEIIAAMHTKIISGKSTMRKCAGETHFSAMGM
jgi:hypothetical protein